MFLHKPFIPSLSTICTSKRIRVRISAAAGVVFAATSFFEIYAAIIQHMPSSTNGNTIDNSTTRVSIIASHWWLWNSYWIPNYVFHKNIALIDPHFDPFFKKPIESKKSPFHSRSKLYTTHAIKKSFYPDN
jgi:hypothetical protein